jgi:serine/threonine protein kinase
MENGKLYLIMEYCEKGDLSQYLERIGSQMEISEQRL